MPELKTMKEWNPQKGDVFCYHREDRTKGADQIFNHWAEGYGGDWINTVGVRCVNGGSGLWELVRRAGPTITFDKEWAYRHTPTQPVRILCVDGYNKDKPVVSMGPDGKVSHHDSHGAFLSGGGESGFDLVPLEKSFGPVWAVFDERGISVVADVNEQWVRSLFKGFTKKRPHKTYTLVKMVEEK